VRGNYLQTHAAGQTVLAAPACGGVGVWFALEWSIRDGVRASRRCCTGKSLNPCRLIGIDPLGEVAALKGFFRNYIFGETILATASLI
jgi:hypothetical protein